VERTRTGIASGSPAHLALATLGVLLVMAVLPAGAIAAPTWLAPNDLSVAGQSAKEPQVAVDAAGDAVAVWRRYDGSDYIIQSASRPAGGNWGPPVDLSAPGQNAEEPQVAVDAAGDAVAVWRRFNGSSLVIQAASRSADGTWEPAVELSASGEDAEEPAVSVDPAGDAVAVWTRSDGSDDIVQAVTRPAGGVWQSTVDLSATGSNASRPHVTLDAAGDAVAVWERFNGANEIVQAAGRQAGGTWQAPTNLSEASEDAEEPAVSVDPAGDAVAVWWRYDGSNEIIQAASRPAGGTWQGPTNLSAPGDGAIEPHVAVDPAGDAVAVWTRYDGSDYIVQSASRAAGGTWGAPADLSTMGQDAGHAEVGVDAAGDAVAVWERFDGSNFVVQAASRAAGGAWGQPQDLSAPGRNAEEPAVAVDSQGDAVAAWERNDGSEEIVQAAGYDAAGPQLRSLSIPTAGTVGVPLSFSVSPFDVWSALGATTWSFGDGTSAVGTAVSHTYGAPGTYTVKVTGADALGNTSTSTGTVAIGAPGAPAPAGRKGAKGKARAGRVVKVKGGAALLTLSCRAGAGCSGTVQLSVATKSKRGSAPSARRKRRPITLGGATFVLPSPGHRTIKVPLTKKSRALVVAAGRKGVKARLAGSGVVGRAVVLKAVGHRHRR
jgi:PKD domain